MLLKKYCADSCFSPCSKCLRMHCINKDTEHARQDRSCFVASGCATCSLLPVCVNSAKDKEVFDLTARLDEAKQIPTCFVAPDCDSCFKASHCRNRHMMNFKLNLEDPSKPLCFSGYHSVK